jgi:hypothetical protein
MRRPFEVPTPAGSSWEGTTVDLTRAAGWSTWERGVEAGPQVTAAGAGVSGDTARAWTTGRRWRRGGGRLRCVSCYAAYLAYRNTARASPLAGIWGRR